MKKLTKLLLLALTSITLYFGFGTLNSFAQVMVKDINLGIGSSMSYNPSLTNVNGILFFQASNGTNGMELWKSDGTAIGTTMVKDIYPGTGSSWSSAITNINGTLFFAASDGIHGGELWKSDGTDAGTVMIKDIFLGKNSSGLTHLTNVNGTLFFTADNGTDGYELWKSDGTDVGTVMVKDISLGYTSSIDISFPSPVFATNNNILFFRTNNGILWKSDGTDTGTIMVNKGYFGSSLVLRGVFNGSLYFTAGDNVNGYGIWKSDGTDTGTVMIKNFSNSWFTDYPFFNNNNIYFFCIQHKWIDYRVMEER